MLSAVLLNVTYTPFMLTVVMLTVVMLSVVMLNVVAPEMDIVGLNPASKKWVKTKTNKHSRFKIEIQSEK